MEKIIEAKNLSKYYKNVMGEKTFKALNAVSLDVRKGEIFGLLGPNGSGKTTFLKLLLGLIFPTSGKAMVLGKSPRDVNIKNKIGYLPEHPYYYDFLMPVELLGFYGSLGRRSSRVSRERIHFLIDKVGLSGFRKMRLRNFSKGMLQRIGFAISLVNDPEVLFLDEPTQGLDPIGTIEIENLLQELKLAGKTIFLSSHLLSQVQDCCDSIAIIYKGNLIKNGRLEELLVSKDKLSLALKGPKSPESLARLTAAVSQSGYELIDVADKKNSLRDLFIELIREEAKNE